MVRVVMDNLNTLTASLYETFPAPEARRIARAVGVSLHAQARQLVEPRIKYGAGYGESELSGHSG